VLEAGCVKTRRQLGCWMAPVRGGKWCGGGLGMAVLLSSCLLRGRNGAAFHDPSPPSRAAKSRELAPRTLLLPLLRHATPSQIHHLSLASLLSTAATAPIRTPHHSLLQRSQPAAAFAIAPAAHSRHYVAILFPCVSTTATTTTVADCRTPSLRSPAQNSRHGRHRSQARSRQ
jgi:hypothetical protein